MSCKVLQSAGAWLSKTLNDLTSWVLAAPSRVRLLYASTFSRHAQG
jgi:hypothetical protein